MQLIVNILYGFCCGYHHATHTLGMTAYGCVGWQVAHGPQGGHVTPGCDRHPHSPNEQRPGPDGDGEHGRYNAQRQAGQPQHASIGGRRNGFLALDLRREGHATEAEASRARLHPAKQTIANQMGHLVEKQPGRQRCKQAQQDERPLPGRGSWCEFSQRSW